MPYNQEALSPISNYILNVELLDSDENVLRDASSDVISGDVSINLQNGARANANVLFDNGTLAYSLNENVTATENIWVDNKISIQTGLVVNGVNQFFSQGIFVIGEYDETSDNSKSSTASYTLYDKMTYLDGTLSGVIVNTFNIANGTNIVNAIKAVLQQAENDGIQIAYTQKPLISVPTTSILTYTLYVAAGRTYYDILTELAQIVNYTIFFDRDGFPNFVPISSPEEEPSILTVVENSGYKISVDKRVLVRDIKNNVRATGTDWDNGVIYDFTSTRTDSPVGTDRIGLRSRLVENDLLASEQQAQDLAVFERNISTRVGQSANLTGLPLDNLYVGNVITLTDALVGLDNARFQINQINIPLLKDSSASYDLTRTVDLGE